VKDSETIKSKCAYCDSEIETFKGAFPETCKTCFNAALSLCEKCTDAECEESNRGPGFINKCKNFWKKEWGEDE